jgi:CRISPR system Cascade subunit CasB
MSPFAESFVEYLRTLDKRDRAALTALRRSLGFAPGAYPPAYPVVERFAAKDGTREPLRQALYLSAGLFALNPRHQPRRSFADALAQTMIERKSDSIERRFIALLSADAETLPTHLRHAVQLLAAGELGFDFAALLDDLAAWLDPWRPDERDRTRQRWARDFYRRLGPAEGTDAAVEPPAEAQTTDSTETE